MVVMVVIGEIETMSCFCKALQVNKDQKISRVSLGGCQATRWLLWI